MKRWIIVAGLLATIAGLVILFRTEAFRRLAWERHVSPGRLSASHRFLEADCAACHTAIRGAEDARCVACHANDTALLQRQPTAFHAGIGNCSQCHFEHQGVNARLTKMNHITLAQIGLDLLNQAVTGSEAKRLRADLLHWVRSHPVTTSRTPGHPQITPLEMTLNCASCHATKDRHAGLFGRECAQCHATTTWTIERFRHPSPRSVECAQCHQAPPSHYMEHFAMISRKIAGQESAQVDQCYRCHQTTSWNDIRGIGWYKHH